MLGCFLYCWFSHLKPRDHFHNFNFKKQLTPGKKQWGPCFAFIWAYTFSGHLLSKKVANSNKRWENCESDGVFHPLGGELMIRDSRKVQMGKVITKMKLGCLCEVQHFHLQKEFSIWPRGSSAFYSSLVIKNSSFLQQPLQIFKPLKQFNLLYPLIS